MLDFNIAATLCGLKSTLPTKFILFDLLVAFVVFFCSPFIIILYVVEAREGSKNKINLNTVCVVECVVWHHSPPL